MLKDNGIIFLAELLFPWHINEKIRVERIEIVDVDIVKPLNGCAKSRVDL